MVYIILTVIIIIIITTTTIIIKVAFILVWLVVGASIFPREQGEPSNIRSQVLALQSLQFQAILVFAKVPCYFFHLTYLTILSINLFDVTPRAPITTGTTTTCDKLHIFFTSCVRSL